MNFFQTSLGALGALSLLSLVACGGEKEPMEVEETATFEDSVQRYCGVQNDRWLIDVISRIDAAIPDAEIMSTGYERVFTQTRIDNGQRVDGEFDLVVRVTATIDGVKNVKHVAVGPIDQVSCEVGTMRGIMGWNIMDMGGEGSFAIQ